MTGPRPAAAACHHRGMDTTAVLTSHDGGVHCRCGTDSCVPGTFWSRCHCGVLPCTSGTYDEALFALEAHRAEVPQVTR